jgi:hypothetical protein
MMELALHRSGPVPSLLARELNNCHRDAMSWAGTFWHQNFREKHFTNAASREYGYHPREGEGGRPGEHGFRRTYTGRKLNKFNHTRPLEWSGESRKRTRTPRIVATATKGEAKVRVVMNAPGLNRRYSGSPIDMRKELTTVSPPEGEQIRNVTSRFLGKRYQISYRKTTRY